MFRQETRRTHARAARVWRVAVLSLFVGSLHAGTSASVKKQPLEILGRNGSALITRDGSSLVVYVVEDGASPRLFLRTLPSEASTPVSPSGDRVDARGEVGPRMVEFPDGALLVVYAVSLPDGKYACELRAQWSRDRGKSWSAPRKVHDDQGARSHQFSDVVMTPKGDAVISWLDSRSGKQGVLTAVAHADGTLERNQIVDAKTCQCCGTALLATNDGVVWLAYRDLAEGDVRNIACAVSRDGGRTFVARGDLADDRWVVRGCPESGPRFTEASDHTVWATWLNGAKNSVEVALSRGGKAFSAPIVVAGGADSRMVNHPEIGVLPDGRLVVFYEVGQGNGSHGIAATVRDASGRWGPPIAVATKGAVPRFVAGKGQALLVYSSHEASGVRMTVLDPQSIFEKK